MKIMIKDFKIKVDFKQLIYVSLSLFTIIFIFNEEYSDSYRFSLILGLIGYLASLIEKKFVFRGISLGYSATSDWSYTKKILFILNSFIVILVFKYIYPVVGSIFGMITYIIMNEINQLSVIYLLVLVVLSSLSIEFLLNFIKRKSYD